MKISAYLKKRRTSREEYKLITAVPAGWRTAVELAEREGMTPAQMNAVLRKARESGEITYAFVRLDGRVGPPFYIYRDK